MKDERLTYYQICNKLACNQDDEFVNSHYKITWSQGRKPFAKHVNFSVFDYQADNMLFNKPEIIECDYIRHVHVPDHLECFIMSDGNEKLLEFGTSVLIHTDEYIENIIFHYREDDYITQRMIDDYANMFSNRCVRKTDYIDNISIKISNGNIFKLHNVMMTECNKDCTEIKFNIDWYESVLN